MIRQATCQTKSPQNCISTKYQVRTVEREEKYGLIQMERPLREQTFWKLPNMEIFIQSPIQLYRSEVEV